MLTHSRLLLTDARLAALRDPLHADPVRDSLLAALRASAATTLDAPAVVRQAIVPYHEFGAQTIDCSRALAGRLILHAFLYRLDGDARHLAAVRRELEASLAFPDWNPAHFLDTAEMLLGVALACDWLHAELSCAEHARLRDAMIERALVPGLAIHETRTGPSAFFPEATSNWNSVCNSALIAGALFVQDHEPALAERVLDHAVASLRFPLGAFEPDGASEEGPTYWNYGATFLCLGLAFLENSSRALPAARLGALRRAARFPLHCTAPSATNFDFADCWPLTGPEFGLAWLSVRHGPAAARQHLRQQIACNRGAPSSRYGGRLGPLLALFLPPPEPSEAIASEPLHAVFRGGAQVAVFRSAWHDPLAAWLGFKAGSNRANHAHLDLGSFVYDQGGVRWARDFGPDAYSLPGYFKLTPPAPWRWSYLRNTNHAHNTLTLADALQPADAVADLVAHGDTWAVADLSAVYQAHVRSWRRGVRLLPDGGLLVRDELSGLAAGVPARWALHTDAAVALAPDSRSATLCADARVLAARISAAPADARFNISAPTPAQPAENPNTGVTRFTLDWIGSGTDVMVEIHLIPGEPAASAPPAGPALERWA